MSDASGVSDAPVPASRHWRRDAELLAGTRGRPECFAAFYDRYERALVGYFMRRTADPEIAADLTAEVFAAALAAGSLGGRGAHSPRQAPAQPLAAFAPTPGTARLQQAAYLQPVTEAASTPATASVSAALVRAHGGYRLAARFTASVSIARGAGRYAVLLEDAETAYAPVGAFRVRVPG